MAKLGHYVVRHDRTGKTFVVRGKTRQTVARRFPAKDYTVLERQRTGGKGG